MKFTSNSPRQTKALAAKLLPFLSRVNLVLLEGDLGSGKTTFVQGLAKLLGSSDRILSPTYLLHRSYKLKSTRFNTMHHLDLYRLGSTDDLKAIDLNELISDPNSLVVVEWAEKTQGITLPKHIKISLSITGEQKRTINIK